MTEQRSGSRDVMVIGHRHPDTDSVCAAISYSRLKNRLDPETGYIPCRAGTLNRETEFVLKHFNTPTPRLLSDASPQLSDVDIRRRAGVDGEMTLRQAWRLMRDEQIDTLCVVSDGDCLKGLITMNDIATANMDRLDPYILANAQASYEKIRETLDAEVLIGDLKDRVVEGRIVIGAGSSEQMERAINKGDLVIVGNRIEGQLTAVEMEAECLVVCAGSRVSRAVLLLAEEKGCIIMRTKYSTYAIGQMIGQAAPIRHYMTSENLLTFKMESSVEDVTRVMSKVRHRYFPVVDDGQHYLGVVSSRNLLSLHPKRLILVDHNEKTQAAEGMDQAEVLEIIDHHRINALETDGPVYFRNVPVGCTCTIIYQMYQENGVEIDPSTAGLMLSAILSDTLMFRSPTCTVQDQRTAEALAKIAGVEMEAYADAMFEAGGDVTGKTAHEIFNGDYKVFTSGETRFGVGQGSYMSSKNQKASEALVGPYLETALNRQGLDYVFYMFTDVRTSTTELMMAGEGAEEVIRRAFQVGTENGIAVLPGVVSRKKQMIPALMGVIKQMAEEK